MLKNQTEDGEMSKSVEIFSVKVLDAVVNCLSRRSLNEEQDERCGERAGSKMKHS